ncbi:MAG: hypothetical protein ACI4P6_06455 [Candidatus Spyradosoma sp.]
MKKIAFFVLLAVSVFAFGAGYDSRREKAARCFGKIRITSRGADFRVSVVESAGEDLRVVVKNYPNDADAPGRWHFVSSGEDFSVQFEEHSCYADFSVRFVYSGEGVR